MVPAISIGAGAIAAASGLTPQSIRRLAKSASLIDAAIDRAAQGAHLIRRGFGCFGISATTVTEK